MAVPSIQEPVPGSPNLMLDIVAYRNDPKNADLKAQLGDDPNAYLKHYVENGYKEGRPVQFFDLNNYISPAINPDLKDYNTVAKGRDHYLKRALLDTTRKLGDITVGNPAIPAVAAPVTPAVPAPVAPVAPATPAAPTALTTVETIQIAAELTKLDKNGDGKIAADELAGMSGVMQLLLSKANIDPKTIVPAAEALLSITGKPTTTTPTTPTTNPTTQPQQPSLVDTLMQGIRGVLQQTLGGGTGAQQPAQGQIATPGTDMTTPGMTNTGMTGGTTQSDPFAPTNALLNAGFSRMDTSFNTVGQQIAQASQQTVSTLGTWMYQGFNWTQNKLNTMDTKLDMIMAQMGNGNGMSTMNAMQQQPQYAMAQQPMFNNMNGGMSQFSQPVMNQSMQNPFGGGGMNGMSGGSYNNSFNTYNYGGMSTQQPQFSNPMPAMQQQQMAFSQPVQQQQYRPMNTAMMTPQYANPMSRTFG